MNKDPVILIVYSSFGDGHIQVANALKQSFAAQGHQRIHLVDLLAESHPLFNAISRFVYLKSATHFPKLYGWVYDWMNRKKPDGILYKWLHGMGKRDMQRLVQRLKPDAVIHTFPVLTISQLNQESKISVPTFTVLTDYVSHSRWIHLFTNRYFVATEQLKASLARVGVNESRISVSGIPIREGFGKPMSKDELRAKYGLVSGTTYLLLVAGAFGVLSDVNEMVKTVMKQSKYEVLLVCGKNKKLMYQMGAVYAGESRVSIFGYVEKMEELMSLSSCLVTKAGGIPLTEASALSIPVVVYRPLPGQEEGNAVSLANADALLIAGTLDELSSHLQSLEEESYRDRMSHAIHEVYVEDAASSIVAEVLQYVEEFQQVHPWASAIEEGQAVHGYH
jgi:processive 1,2-diacylglycerol beta-glucosyltransferase